MNFICNLCGSPDMSCAAFDSSGRIYCSTEGYQLYSRHDMELMYQACVWSFFHFNPFKRLLICQKQATQRGPLT